MTKYAMTGGDGFLGWHTRCALLEQKIEAHDIPVGRFFDPAQALRAVDGSERLIHLAGVNRGTDDEVRQGNAEFARQIAEVLAQCANPPSGMVYANSIQAFIDNVYGRAKAEAADILAQAAAKIGAGFFDVRFPNLYGEHGRPFYNSVTATFCHLLAQGGTPSVDQDRELRLLHAQDAADILIGATRPDQMSLVESQATVTELLSRLQDIARIYRAGQIPDISTAFQRNLFNTYRSFTLGGGYGIRLTRHADPRGSFFETVRSHGSPGQVSFSTTVPGVTRGDHFHRRKVERFVVLSGQATMRLRRCLTDETIEIQASGDEPVAVDMPTMWSHNITNTGQAVLYTQFWTNELFDEQHPDTIFEKV